MDGILEEAEEIAGDVEDKQVLDAALDRRGAGRRALRDRPLRHVDRLGGSVGHDDVVRLLNTNLNEEKAADKKLSSIAERKGVNRKAAS